MSIKTHQTSNARPSPEQTAGRDELWTSVFAPSGALSGLCLEWILDKAEFNNGRPS